MLKSIYPKIFSQNKNKNKNKNNKAFTLIEILIYTAIFSVVAAGIMGVTWNITKIHDTQIAQNEVDENIRYVMNLVNSKVRESIIIQEATGTSLILQMPDSTKSPVKFSLKDGVMYMQVGAEDPVAITSNKVEVSFLSFERIAVAGAKGGVKVNLTIAYKSSDTKTAFSRDYLTTVTKVNAITFDSDILPDVTNLRNVGVESLRWKNGYFSGDVNVTGNLTTSGYLTGTTGICMGTDCRTSWGQIAGLTGSGEQNYISKWTTSGTLNKSIIYDNGTNVGIGTTSPNAKLHLESNSGELILRMNNIASGGRNWELNSKNESGSFSIIDRTANSDRLFITSSGNVGINTTSPTQKLDINGNLKVGGGNIYGGVGGGVAGIWIYSTTYPNYGIFYSDLSTDRMDFSPNGGGTSTPAMSIAGTNVGIGTTSPGQKLDVSGGNIRTTGQFISTVAAGTAPLAITSNTLVTNLNADLLDSIDSSRIIYGAGVNGVNGAPATWVQSDLSQYKAGFWDAYGASWAPDTNWWWGLTLAHRSNSPTYLYGGQIVMNNSLTPQMYIRGMAGGATGNVGSWQKVWTSYSDGSGSGLDADTLDGHDTSYFQTALTNPVTGTGIANYVPKWTSATTQSNSLIFDNGTNVGISTTSPAYKLDVQGGGFRVQNTGYFAYNGLADIYFSGGSDRGVGGRALVADGGNSLTINYAGDFSGGTKIGTNTFFAANTGNSYINTGNVGIATTSPAYKLDVAGDIRATGNLFGTLSATNISAGTFGANTGGGNFTFPVDLTVDRTFKAQNFKAGTHKTAANDYMIAYSGWGVGWNDAAASWQTLGDGVNNGGGMIGATIGSGKMYFYTFPSTGGSNRTISDSNLNNYIAMTIDPNGKVGIGTTSPGQKLDVSGGNIRTTGQLISTIAAGTAPLVVTSNTLVSNLNADLLDGHDSSYFQTALTNPVTGTGSANYISKWTGTNTQGNSLIYDNGAGIGIATTSPGYRLDVQGGGFRVQNDSSYFTFNGVDDIYFAGESSRGDGGRAFVADGNDSLTINYAGDFSGGTKIGVNTFFAANTGNSYINTGKLGIGTTEPDEELHIKGSSSSNSPAIKLTGYYSSYNRAQTREFSSIMIDPYGSGNGSGKDWYYINDARSSDYSFATIISLDKGGMTDYLYASNFKFAIPSGSTISGISVTVQGRSDQQNCALSVQLMSSISHPLGNVKTVDSIYSSTQTDGGLYFYLGGSSDLWGTSLDYGDINSSNFGLDFWLKNNNSSYPVSAYINSITITVYYFYNNTAADWTSSVSTSKGDLLINNSLIDTRVGIRNSNPRSTLDVNGVITGSFAGIKKFRVDVNGQGNSYVNTAIYYPDWFCALSTVHMYDVDNNWGECNVEINPSNSQWYLYAKSNASNIQVSCDASCIRL